MSILRQVERYIANQQTFKALNAFIALEADTHALKKSAVTANERLSGGPLVIHILI